MRLCTLLAAEILAQKNCPSQDRCSDLGINEVWKKCKDLFEDVIGPDLPILRQCFTATRKIKIWKKAEPNAESPDEIINPAAAPRNTWATEFQNLAEQLLNNQASSNQKVKNQLINYFSTQWPADGWLVVVASDNLRIVCRTMLTRFETQIKHISYMENIIKWMWRVQWNRFR